MSYCVPRLASNFDLNVYLDYGCGSLHQAQVTFIKFHFLKANLNDNLVVIILFEDAGYNGGEPRL